MTASQKPSKRWIFVVAILLAVDFIQCLRGEGSWIEASYVLTMLFTGCGLTSGLFLFVTLLNCYIVHTRALSPNGGQLDKSFGIILGYCWCLCLILGSMLLESGTSSNHHITSSAASPHSHASVEHVSQASLPIGEERASIAVHFSWAFWAIIFAFINTFLLNNYEKWRGAAVFALFSSGHGDVQLWSPTSNKREDNSSNNSIKPLDMLESGEGVGSVRGVGSDGDNQSIRRKDAAASLENQIDTNYDGQHSRCMMEIRRLNKVNQLLDKAKEEAYFENKRLEDVVRMLQSQLEAKAVQRREEASSGTYQDLGSISGGVLASLRPSEQQDQLVSSTASAASASARSSCANKENELSCALAKVAELETQLAEMKSFRISSDDSSSSSSLSSSSSSTYYQPEGNSNDTNINKTSTSTVDSEHLKSLQVEHTRVLEQFKLEITTLENECARLKEQMRKQQEELQTSKASETQLQQEIQQLSGLSQKLESQNQVIQQEHEQVLDQVRQRLSEWQEKDKQLHQMASLQSQIAEKEKENRLVRTKCAQLEQSLHQAEQNTQKTHQEKDMLEQEIVALKQEAQIAQESQSDVLSQHKEQYGALEHQLATCKADLHASVQQKLELEEECVKFRQTNAESQLAMEVLDKHNQELETKMNQEITRMSSQIQELENQLNQIQAENHDLDKTNINLTKKHKRLEIEKRDLRRENDAVEAVVTELEKKEEKYREEIALLKQAVAENQALASMAHVHEANVKSLENEKHQLQSQMDTQENSYQSLLQAAEQEKESLRVQVIKLDTEYQEKLTQLEQKYQSDQDTRQAQQAQEQEGLEQQFTQLRQANSTLQSQQDELREELKQAEETQHELNQQYNIQVQKAAQKDMQSQEEIARILKETQLLESELQLYKVQAKGKDEQIAELEVQMANNRTAIRELKLKIRQQVLELERVKESNRVLQDQACTNNEQSQEDVQLYQRTIEKLETELTREQAELEQVKIELANAQSRAAEAIEEVNHVNNAKDELISSKDQSEQKYQEILAEKQHVIDEKQQIINARDAITQQLQVVQQNAIELREELECCQERHQALLAETQKKTEQCTQLAAEVQRTNELLEENSKKDAVKKEKFMKVVGKCKALQAEVVNLRQQLADITAPSSTP